MGKGQELYKKAKTMIPGGTSLLSKRPEQLLPKTGLLITASLKVAKYGIWMVIITMIAP